MSHRIVDRLFWADRAAERPPGIPISRPRGAKASGIRYEKALAKMFGTGVIRGQWWEFRDRNGHGFCQTDLFQEGERFALVMESKYTWCPEGHSQLELLYRPVVEFAVGKPVLGIQVCRILKPNMPSELTIVNDIASAIDFAKSGSLVVLHCSIPSTATVMLRREQRAVGP